MPDLYPRGTHELSAAAATMAGMNAILLLAVLVLGLILGTLIGLLYA